MCCINPRSWLQKWRNITHKIRILEWSRDGEKSIQKCQLQTNSGSNSRENEFPTIERNLLLYIVVRILLITSTHVMTMKNAHTFSVILSTTKRISRAVLCYSILTHVIESINWLVTHIRMLQFRNSNKRTVSKDIESNENWFWIHAVSIPVFIFIFSITMRLTSRPSVHPIKPSHTFPLLKNCDASVRSTHPSYCHSHTIIPTWIATNMSLPSEITRSSSNDEAVEMGNWVEW